jgi:hypothetical protein
MLTARKRLAITQCAAFHRRPVTDPATGRPDTAVTGLFHILTWVDRRLSNEPTYGSFEVCHERA